MIATATLAVAYSLFEGIGELSIYFPNVRAERSYWQHAATSEAMKDAIRAEEWRQKALELGRRNRASLPYILTAISLTGLGVISLVFGIAIKARYGNTKDGRPAFVNTLAATCSTITRIVIVAWAIGMTSLVGAFILLMPDD